jgi:hypothetical protein
MSVQEYDYSDDVVVQHVLGSFQIDPITVHLVSVNGTDWSGSVASSGSDSDLNRRVIDVVPQIMDLDRT